MGNAEIEKILKFVEKLCHNNEVLVKEYEKKMYANEEMSIEDRIHYTIKFCEYNAVCIALKSIISMVKDSFETEKFFEGIKQKKTINSEDEKTKIANPIRQALISQLKELVNPAQARTLEELEKAVLSPEEYTTNIPFHTWMHRTQGVIQVILNTPEYSDDTRVKIIDIMHKLVQIQCL